MLLEGIELSTSPLPKQSLPMRALILLAFLARDVPIFAPCSPIYGATGKLTVPLATVFSVRRRAQRKLETSRGVFRPDTLSEPRT
jgi:hypothetical protein